ncbi:MAG: hypothetical protein WDN67_03350 [Candidatus Moraniibacteriota bacterium]
MWNSRFFWRPDHAWPRRSSTFLKYVCLDVPRSPASRYGICRRFPDRPLLAVRFLISFSKKHTFVSFGIYRMLVAIVFFLFFL